MKYLTPDDVGAHFVLLCRPSWLPDDDDEVLVDPITATERFIRTFGTLGNNQLRCLDHLAQISRRKIGGAQ